MNDAAPPVIEFADREVMAARLADLVASYALVGQSFDSIAELAVSGGSTPKALYENLSARALSWRRTRLTIVDERWVGADHPRSNETFVRSAFATADGVEIRGLYNGAGSPEDGEKDLTLQFSEDDKNFDAVILGMGSDGHTASWFPHADGLEGALNSDQPVCAVTATKSEVTGDETERMTLTLSAIRNARLIVLMLTGGDKRAAYEKACADGSVEDMPVRAILRARPDMWVAWAP